MKKYLNTLIKFIKTYSILIILFVLYILITYLLKIPNCLIKLICGYPCPGCGMTRAGISILKFDFVNAFNFNPLIYILPLVLFVIIFKEYSIVSKIYHQKIFWVSLLILTISLYVYRMIFVYPEVPMNYDNRNLIEWIKNKILL